MVQHVNILSENSHEPKHITNSTTADTGKVITASSSTNGQSEFRTLLLEEIDTTEQSSPLSYWAFYADSEYTEGSPLSVDADVRTRVTIDGDGTTTDTSNLPIGIEVWDSTENEFTPQHIDDAYILRLTYKCQSSASDPYIIHELDIGGSEDTILEEDRRIRRGPSESNTMVINWPVFIGSTFLANGGSIFITPSEDTDFWDFAINIFKIHQGG